MGVRSLERLCIVALCACLIGFAIPARAQQTTASIVGTVTDTSGAVIPGATVKITNTGTGITQTKTTNSSGDYVFTLLIPGAYTVTVTSTGFKTYTVPAISLAAGDSKREDAKLQVGAMTQTVTVQATTPALQTQTANLSTLVTSQAVESLPLNGRNVTTLVQYAMGVNQGSPNDLMAGSRPDDRRPTAAFSANGAGDSANNSMIDGFDNNAVIGTTMVRPSIDGIREVRVQTNTYSAKLTRVAGAAVNIVTKSGTNAYHGSLYEFFRNSVLDANPSYSFPAAYSSGGQLLYTNVLPKGSFRQNQYGGSIGGPIRKDKTFFFGDLEQFRMGKAEPVTDTVPTLCNRGLAACPDGLTQFGDFSDQPDASLYGGSPTECQPNTTVVALGTCPYVDVPSGSITTLGRAYFNMFPLPTSSALTNNYSNNVTASQNFTTWDARIDQHFNDQNTLFGRYSFNDTTTITPSDFPVVHIDPATGDVSSSGVAVNPGTASFFNTNNYPGPARERAQGLALSFTHLFSPTFLVNLKAGYSRWSNNSNPPNSGTYIATKLGFPCDSVSCVNLPNYGMSSGLPTVNVVGMSVLGDPIFLPIVYVNNTFQYMGDFTLTKGKHEFQWGASLIRRQNTRGQSENPEGAFSFAGFYTGSAGADLLEGLGAGPAGGGLSFLYGTRTISLDQPNGRNWEWGFYGQDNYRVTPWLTLNLGMRYDIFTQYTERMGRFSTWDPTTGYLVSPIFPGAQQSSATGNLKNNYFNFSPRFGFAASLTRTLVVRGGFGITFWQPVSNPGGGAPFTYAYTCQVQNQAGTNTTCPAPFANGLTTNYGLPTTYSSSQLGQTGGDLLAAGRPVPHLDIQQVLPPVSCPAGADPTSAGCSAGGGNNYVALGSLSSLGFKVPTPYLEQFSLEIQKEVAGNVLGIAYVGELGRHQGGSWNLNATNTPETRGKPPLAYQYGYSWLIRGGASVPHSANNTYFNSLQASFVRRFKAGLTTNVNFVWEHALSAGSGPCSAIVSPANLGYGNGPKYVDPCYYDNLKNPSSPYVVNTYQGMGYVSNTGLDTPYRLAGTISYQIPFGQHLTGLEGQLLKGWSMNAAGFWQSGIVFNVANGGGVPGVGGGLDQVCSGRAAHPSLEDWINEACFRQPSANTYGTANSNQLFGPRWRTLDYSVFKNFQLTERFTMQFRTEFFNLFNMVNFAPPGGTPGNATANARIRAFDSNHLGLPQSSPRQLHAGAITGLNSNIPARQIQFALKLLF